MDIMAFGPSTLLESLPERREAGLHVRIVLSEASQHADAPNPVVLLRPRRERPGRCRAAQQRYELAALHSITLSVRASSVGGTSRPSALAVIRLMTRSNLVGCSTGISPGFAPRRILST